MPSCEITQPSVSPAVTVGTGQTSGTGPATGSLGGAALCQHGDMRTPRKAWWLAAAVLAGSTLPGGTGQSFDWTLLSGRRWAKPWMLSGGLHAGNVAQAARISGAAIVDVSSGVESAPGRKDPAAIRAFLDAVRRL